MEQHKSLDQCNLCGELNLYEEVLSNCIWGIMLLLILADSYISFVLGQEVFHRQEFYVQIIPFIGVVLLSVYKMYRIKKERFLPDFLFVLLKVLDILLITFFLNTVKNGYFFSFMILLPVVSICITRGFKVSMPYLGFGIISHLSFLAIRLNLSNNLPLAEQMQRKQEYYIFAFIIYIVLIIFLRLIGIYHNQFTQNEQDNQKLVEQLGRKYAQLEEARREKQEQYDRLKEVNLQLEDSNKKLTSSLAEFFTLQQISQAISSIFDMNELLQFVNDIIIGVMGVSTSNIALYGANGDRLKVQVSNILNKKDRAILTDNINSPVIRDAIDKGQTILNNNVNADEFDFTRGRNVKSLICVPLQVKGKVHGLVLIEHSIPEAFDDDNVRLLEIITQQVSIAIDNASLYEQLQEYANTDGLTQVYNRVFFQNRLQNELEQAQQQGYEVSVILYDIDNFKRFNDSYGHLFGDIVLKSIAQLVKESVRKDDVVARFGGEEFIVLLPHTGKELAFEKAEELRRKIADLTVKDKVVSASVTVSMGVSTFPALAQSELTLLNSADEALYLAKRSGKNCVKLAHPQESQAVAEETAGMV